MALDAPAVEYPTPERQQKAGSSVDGEQEDRRFSGKGLLGKGYLGRLFNRVRRVKVKFGGRHANGGKYHEIEEDLSYEELECFITMADRTLRNNGRVSLRNRRSLTQQVVSYIARLTFSVNTPATARLADGRIYDPSSEAIEKFRTIEDFFGPANTAFMISHGKRSSKSKEVAERMEVLQIRR
uniref:Uncharacterized protein n=1 Tax=Peronospora matthiolae TaxID=2874970 RepID=A0AAV1U869_9STRA